MSHEQAEQILPTTTATGLVSFRATTVRLDRPGDPAVFGARTRADAAAIIARYPQGQARSALLPLLHLVQSEQGYLTPDGIAFCAEQLELTKAQVGAVATFYTMFKHTSTGEYLVSVCTNTVCGMLGGDEIFAALCEQLSVANGETTHDGAITLEHAECLAACDYAPVVTVNYEFFDNQTVDTARALAGRLQVGERPVPSRGAPLCTFGSSGRSPGSSTTTPTPTTPPPPASRPRSGCGWPATAARPRPPYPTTRDEVG